MKLTRTTVQLTRSSIEELKKLYPELSFSEAVRFAIDYLLIRQPLYVPATFREPDLKINSVKQEHDHR